MPRRLEARPLAAFSLIALAAASLTGLVAMAGGESRALSLSPRAPSSVESRTGGVLDPPLPGEEGTDVRTDRRLFDAGDIDGGPARGGRWGPAVPRSGATSVLTVHVLRGDDPVAARAELAFGPNQGRALLASPDGALRADGLFPGFALLRLSVPGVGSLTRDVRLQPSSGVELVIDLSDRRWIEGRVTDEDGRGLALAEVTVDGVEARTGADGWYRTRSMASGRPLVIVRMPGYAPYCSTALGAVPRSDDGHMDVVLEQGCELEVTPRLDAAAGECLVYVVPRGGQRSGGQGGEAAFPWFLSAPARGAVDENIRLHDLPRGRVEVYVLHPWGWARSGVRDLRPDACIPVELALQPRPRLEGRVLRGGEPVEGALVVLEAANRMRATVASLPGAEELYRQVGLEYSPAAFQEVRTDSFGRFRLGDWRGVGGRSFLTVVDPEETIQITRELLDSMDCSIDLTVPTAAGLLVRD